MRLLPLLLLLLLATGCSASASFHSRTGAAYRPIAVQAVRCDDREADLIVAAGGTVIGTISAKALAINASQEDLADKAAVVAAKNGGTHVVLTERGIETFSVYNPAQKTTQCVRQEGQVECQSTYFAATTSTYEKPTAKFVVFRVARESWPRLPEEIRPIGDGS